MPAENQAGSQRKDHIIQYRFRLSGHRDEVKGNPRQHQEACTQSGRSPFSPRIRMLRRILAKLRPEPPSQPFTPAIVGQVKPGSAAEQGGIRPGNLIVKIGTTVHRCEDIQQAVRLNPGFAFMATYSVAMLLSPPRADGRCANYLPRLTPPLQCRSVCITRRPCFAPCSEACSAYWFPHFRSVGRCEGARPRLALRK